MMPVSFTQTRINSNARVSQTKLLSTHQDEDKPRMTDTRLFLNREKQEENSALVDKNEQGFQQDVEQRPERLSLDITKTKYTQMVKSAPDAYISFAEKGASNAQ